MEETQSLEVTQIIEKPDHRIDVLQAGIKESVLHPSDNVSSHIRIISEQYASAAPLVDSLSESGKTSELIAALEGMAQSAGIKDFEVSVSLPEDAHPGEKARAMTDRARELYQQMPDLIAAQYTSKYKELQEKEANAYQRLEAATQKDDAEVSRAEVRALAFDRRLIGYEMTDEEDRLLELIDASRGLQNDMQSARSEAHSGRIDTQRALEIVSEKREQALQNKIAIANGKIAAREQKLEDMLNERPMLPTLAASRDLDEAATVLAGYWPDLANEKIAIEFQKEHARLLPLVDKIKEGKEAVGEKAVQLRNAVKDGWDVVIRRTASGYVNDLKEVANAWKANVGRNKSELAQEEIQGKREYYDRRHEIAVQKQMKTELELVRRQGREQGLSAARIEGMLEERRQQFAEVKNPNENIAYFQNKLAEHVHVLVQIEAATALDDEETRPIEPVVFNSDRIAEDVTDSDATTRMEAIDIRNFPIEQHEESADEVDTKNVFVPPVGQEQVVQHQESPDEVVTKNVFVPPVAEELDTEIDLSAPTSEALEEHIFEDIQRHWNRLARINRDTQDPDLDPEEKPHIEDALESEQQFIEDLKERERNGLRINNQDLERYINAYRATIYLLAEKYRMRDLRKGQEPLSDETFENLYTELGDKKNALESALNPEPATN